MKRVLGFLMALMICLGVFTLVGGVNTVKAAEDDIASGVYGGVDWRITSDYELIFGKIGETQTMSFFDSASSESTAYGAYRSNVKSIRFDGHVIAPNSLYMMCSNYTELERFSFLNFDLSETGNISWMFNCCYKLYDIDFDGINTSNVANFRALFYRCYALQNLDLTMFDVNKGTDLGYMFYGTKGLKSVDLSTWNTSSATCMEGMFYGSGVDSLEINHFNMSRVTNIGAMFSGCVNLKELDLSRWDVSSVTTIAGVANSIRRGIFSNNTDNGFSRVNGIEKLDISGWNLSNLANKFYLFDGLASLEQIKLGQEFSFGQGLLPVRGGGYTGKWLRVDKAYGPYTPVELRNSYTSEMAGTWVAEVGENPYAVFDSETKTLSFVRAKEIHDNNSTGTVKSISGGEYTGQIFVVNETAGSANEFNGSYATWRDVRSQVKQVVFVDEIKPRYTGVWFDGFTQCTEMDLAKLNMSNVVNTWCMFNDCSSIVSLDLSTWKTPSLVDGRGMFQHMYALETLDVRNMDTSHITRGATISLGDKYRLKEITIGENFKFSSSYVFLTVPPSSESGIAYTGKWVLKDDDTGETALTRDEMVSAGYITPGTWVWQKAQYKISFDCEDGSTGSMPTVMGNPASKLVLPINKFMRFGYTFDHWDDGNGHTYADQGTIPANTYQADQKVTLTAVFKKRDTSLNWDGNEAEFSIRGGEQAVLDNIPAGTSYQVYELTPNGWVLVQQENASGVIDALKESAAAFWNKYQPGVTTAQFSGLKYLDGQPAKADAFEFELWEGDKLIETVSTLDGGFIQFGVIKYDNTMLGEHVYTIKEVNSGDDSIDYDTHEDVVVVDVVDNGDGTLSNTVTYDDDGVVFSNATRPGNLRVTKDVTNGTSQNANDEFTLEIEFRNESGMPFGDDIYWYIEDANPSED